MRACRLLLLASAFVDLEMGKYNIDMLGVIQEKTKDNLSDQESKLLEDTLHQLRMTFVQSSSQVG